MLSSKKLFVELLRSFINKGWVQAVNEEVQEIPHSFVLQDFKRQEADLVYRVKLNGQDVVFYLLLEMQSTVDFRMPYRLLLYQVEIWRYLLQNEEDALSNRKTFQLPPIVPIVLYNGTQKWSAAELELRKLLANENLFGSELLNFEYLLIDVARYTEEELLALSNAIGSVFLLDQTEDQEQLLNRFGKLMNTIQQMPADSQQKFVAWMANILLQKLPENEPSLQQFIQNVKGDASFMGLEKVFDDIERKGQQKGKEDVAKQLIRMGMDDSSIVRATGFSVQTIEDWRKQAY
ncbi:Rpn family recombination-promoting nuclease/putative transposase [Paenibacillus zanthoxyli]|uniref:Rpn family recombination-promoting nuclease/putative transposase n=1 Tax=Paenibacillus zanthoxyli TaxID=369399 RepID=UPI0004B58593|nr:Rpn family recombination-promoting nuclease/putative transposase [Paenibacillus zanthoxyli]